MSRMIPAGRKIFLMGLNAPYSARGFDANAFARRVQDLLAPFAPRVALDPQVPVNPLAERWVEESFIRFNNRVDILAIGAIIVDGTFSMEELAAVLARAVRDAGAGTEVVAAAVAERMLSCDDSVFFSTDEFGGCCLTVNDPRDQMPRALAIPNPPSDPFVLRSRTTVRQGVAAQPVPSPIPPDSIPSTQAPTPTPTGSNAYSGDPEHPIIPDNKSDAISTTKLVVGGALAAVAVALTIAAVTVSLKAGKALPPPQTIAAPARAPSRRAPRRPARRGR